MQIDRGTRTGKMSHIKDAAKATTSVENVICVDVEYPHQLASKNYVPSRKYGRNTTLEPLCGTGVW